MNRYRPIKDYAVIGDCRSAALISKEGSLDWLCWPRFDSPAVFAALLDADRGGRFAVRPTGAFTAERRYREDTCILETTFRTGGGTARLIDLMPVGTEEEKQREIWPEHQILRVIEGVDGAVPFEAIFDPRWDYGRTRPTLEGRGEHGIHCSTDAEILVLRSDFPLEVAGGGGARGACAVRAGERTYLSLTYAHGQPAYIPPLDAVAERRIEQTERWWREWMHRCSYDGPYQAAVFRSALTLKLMNYAPSGAVVAAPTTSLPEHIGGVRNWDYRYCWVRDAALTLEALFQMGYGEEARSFFAWMLHATRETLPLLSVLYDVYGGRPRPERELTYLEGYMGSAPVRVGNAAQGQLQLDMYGEVVQAAYTAYRRGERPDRSTRRLLVSLGDTVCKRWREPDEGIWEPRAGRRQHTYSKAMCWIALDRLLDMAERGVLTVPEARFRRTRDQIEEVIETRGWSDEIESYVTVLDGDDVDASLLLLGLEGYTDPGSERMRATCQRIHERLGENGTLYRYLNEDGLPGEEGTFGICSFWAVECRAKQDDLDGAIEAFEHLLSLANDVGLYAEEFDPRSGAALGNFPQAFTHVGLISAAFALEACADRQGTTTHERRPSAAEASR